MATVHSQPYPFQGVASVTSIKFLAYGSLLECNGENSIFKSCLVLSSSMATVHSQPYPFQGKKMVGWSCLVLSSSMAIVHSQPYPFQGKKMATSVTSINMEAY